MEKPLTESKKKEYKVAFSDVEVHVELKPPTKDDFVEINFRESVIALQQKKDTNKINNGEINISSVDTDEIKQIASYFERKYGTSSGILTEDWEALGYGYDENDPLIDNSEAIQECIPEKMTTEFSGFYVSSGKINLQQKSTPEKQTNANLEILKKKSTKRIRSPNKEQSNAKGTTKKIKSTKKTLVEPEKLSQIVKDLEEKSSNVAVEICNLTTDNKDDEEIETFTSPKELPTKYQPENLILDENFQKTLEGLDENTRNAVNHFVTCIKSCTDQKKFSSNPEISAAALRLHEYCSRLSNKHKLSTYASIAIVTCIPKAKLCKMIRQQVFKRKKSEFQKIFDEFKEYISLEETNKSLSVAVSISELPEAFLEKLKKIVEKGVDLFPNQFSKVSEFKTFIEKHLNDSIFLLASSCKLELKLWMEEIKRFIPCHHQFSYSWESYTSSPPSSAESSLNCSQPLTPVSLMKSESLEKSGKPQISLPLLTDCKFPPVSSSGNLPTSISPQNIIPPIKQFSSSQTERLPVYVQNQQKNDISQSSALKSLEPHPSQFHYPHRLPAHLLQTNTTPWMVDQRNIRPIYHLQNKIHVDTSNNLSPENIHMNNRSFLPSMSVVSPSSNFVSDRTRTERSYNIQQTPPQFLLRPFITPVTHHSSTNHQNYNNSDKKNENK